MNMKGVTDVEFVLAVIVFLGIITFVTFTIISKIPLLRSQSSNEDLQSKTYEISQLLLMDQGEPTGWNSGNVKRIGLSAGEKYVLSGGKINSLAGMCAASYESVRNLLGQNKTDVRISITDSYDTDILECGPRRLRTSRPEFQITRFATLQNGTIVRMIVSVF